MSINIKLSRLTDIPRSTRFLMRYSTYTSLLLALLAISACSQTNTSPDDRKAAQISLPLTLAANTITDGAGGIELLKKAEAEAAALDGAMRAWVFWQIGIG